jgi:hypothetical protein
MRQRAFAITRSQQFGGTFDQISAFDEASFQLLGTEGFGGQQVVRPEVLPATLVRCGAQMVWPSLHLQVFTSFTPLW